MVVALFLVTTVVISRRPHWFYCSRLVLQECDVDLQEQGMLLLQDEFLVQKGRHKAARRHLFLFEDLLVFAKPKKVAGAQDEYTYKSSLKVKNNHKPAQFFPC